MTGTIPTFAETLVANIVDPATVVPSNESFTGIEASSGEFQDGDASGLEMDNGVLLTSGLFHLWDDGLDIEFADENQDSGFTNYKEAGDPEMECLVAGTFTRDAAILQFDAFCQNSQLEIEYQFGSEEYVWSGWLTWLKRIASMMPS